MIIKVIPNWNTYANDKTHGLLVKITSIECHISGKVSVSHLYRRKRAGQPLYVYTIEEYPPGDHYFVYYLRPNGALNTITQMDKETQHSDGIHVSCNDNGEVIAICNSQMGEDDGVSIYFGKAEDNQLLILSKILLEYATDNEIHTQWFSPDRKLDYDFESNEFLADHIHMKDNKLVLDWMNIALRYGITPPHQISNYFNNTHMAAFLDSYGAYCNPK